MRDLSVSELEMVFGGDGPTGQPGDGYWQPGDYDWYNGQADLFDAYANGSASLGMLAAGLAAFLSPTAVGAVVAGLSAVAAGAVSALAKHIADGLRQDAINEMMDRVKQLERDTEMETVH